MSLTDDEKAEISMHLGYEVTPPYTDYVLLYLHPSFQRVADSAASLTLVRDLLTKANAAWEKYNASLTKQELDESGAIKFSKRGEHRLLSTHRTICLRLARALNVKANFSTGRGGLKYR